MTQSSFTGKNGVYKISSELGKGGEGCVYELSSHPGLALKIYNDALTPEKVNKLQLMTSMATQEVQAYAAWPLDVVADSKGNVCGLVMQKLQHFVPLHMLFSPIDRKKIFPDKGYNFLVHVAKNICAAFHTLHAHGLVVGDVNEGNILVNEQGMISFIDCDSFQLQDGEKYYFCEVGVPRYTPPELLREHSFENIVRTVNTDNFSMAILLFQLLFLGRHPFAGINTTDQDIDEETAIRYGFFAYSLKHPQKNLLPPRDSLPMNSLPEKLAALFHHAFESNTDRPLTSDWIPELESYKAEMISCPKSTVHFYYGKLQTCPWCAFKENRNIVYFLDDNDLNSMLSLNDIERFTNGFRVEPLKFPPLPKYMPPHLHIAPGPSVQKYRYYKIYQYSTVIFWVVFCIVLSSVTGVMISVFAGTGIVFGYKYLPWKRWLDKEVKRREDLSDELRNRMDALHKQYNNFNKNPHYMQFRQILETSVVRYRQLPSAYKKLKETKEEAFYDKQLHTFLKEFKIKDHSIPGFGAARKQMLEEAGIVTAADITKFKTMKLHGIGPSFHAKLLSWQRQMATNFVYRPDNNLLAQQLQELEQEIKTRKQREEQEIRNNYHNFITAKNKLITIQKELYKEIEDLIPARQEAEISLKEIEPYEVF